VLASVALADHPRVMLPIITYNLVQHLVAGAVAFLLSGAPTGQIAQGDDESGFELVRSKFPSILGESKQQHTRCHGPGER
jgi:hypothetical protein